MITEIFLVLFFISISMSILGVFLVLGGLTMVIDAITHTILLGIIIGFFVAQDLNSPILIVFATIIGTCSFYLISLLTKHKFINNDSSIALVFPFLFSIAIVLISKFAANIHLDIDSVLLGEIVFVPFDRFEYLDVPKGIVSNFIVMIINIAFVTILYKELKLVFFDKLLAKNLGLNIWLINMLFIVCSSISVTVSFEAIGSVLLIAFIACPSICAYLLTKDIFKMILTSIAISIVCSFLGFYFALYFDLSVPGSIGSLLGILSILVILFSPKGVFSKILHRKNKQFEFALQVFLNHIKHHNNTNINELSNIFDNILLDKLINYALSNNLITQQKDTITLSSKH